MYLFFFESTAPVAKKLTSFVTSSLYPQDPVKSGIFHITAEYFYEFLSGTHMSDQDSLDRCEQNITDFTTEYHAAFAYYKEGKAQNSMLIMREGIFRIADSLMRVTNMTWQCYSVTVLV